MKTRLETAHPYSRLEAPLSSAVWDPARCPPPCPPPPGGLFGKCPWGGGAVEWGNFLFLLWCPRSPEPLKPHLLGACFSPCPLIRALSPWVLVNLDLSATLPRVCYGDLTSILGDPAFGDGGTPRWRQRQPACALLLVLREELAQQGSRPDGWQGAWLVPGWKRLEYQCGNLIWKVVLVPSGAQAAHYLPSGPSKLG